MYYKKVDYKDLKACFDFLVDHFEYDTMNSWNGCRSIAHNVKIYNLPVDDDDALKALEEDGYFTINETIRNWEADHPGYSVSFNGRSGGYLVLYSNDHNGHVFKNIPLSPCQYDSYEYWKNDVIECYGYLEYYQSELEWQVKLVQEFDKLCDDLIEVVKQLIEDMHRREALTKKYSATLRFQRYYYDTVEDLKLHMLDMKRRGYSVWEWSAEDEEAIYAEYEMNESIDSQIVLDEEGDEEFVYENN